MEHKKDIENQLKDLLENAQKAPKQGLWERLDTSLDKRDKKRRGAAWLWYGGAGILLALLLLGGIMWTPTEKNTIKNVSEILDDKTTNENDIIVETAVEDRDTISDKNVITIQNKRDTPIENNTEIGDENISTTKKKNEALVELNSTSSKKDANINKKSMTKDGFTITTTHEYYNSDLDTTTTSQSKKKIDSLVAANKRIMAIKDSIARKRARDSIKLNQTSRDSVPQ